MKLRTTAVAAVLVAGGLYYGATQMGSGKSEENPRVVNFTGRWATLGIDQHTRRGTDHVEWTWSVGDHSKWGDVYGRQGGGANRWADHYIVPHSGDYLVTMIFHVQGNAPAACDIEFGGVRKTGRDGEGVCQVSTEITVR